eukprot:CAMPEP_0203671310 /NCGR_PEP_ID=MMETSP0090-20130426/7133_1 /ASSEMBLY_ACC=CAM_ASM_001088 /TAXON_ID=426623 /ORGANISM="Chaetoceros affinis, Strain CCMP159" /LENGTH=1131 /DNA_ID=CAMNT_0050536351 /DNA_START=81 /DNA_END=3473 /DNA_ORIENTATION=+
MAGLVEKARPKSTRLQADSKVHRRLVEYFVVVSSVPQNPQKDPSDIVVVTSTSTGTGASSQWDLDSHSALLEKEIERKLSFEAVITSRYPLKDHDKNPLLHESVVSFCHPSEEIKLKHDFTMPKIHYFVSTGGRGAQMYGVCLTLYEPFSVKVKYQDSEGSKHKLVDIFRPKCICILSSYPYLVAFREYLTQLERLSKSGEMTVPIERYISNFCSEVAAPPPGSFEVQTTIGDSTIKIWSPPDNQPIAWVSLPFADLFECLDIKSIIQVWHALALERQVLLVSTQKTLLTTAAEILVSLLFPMKWSHAYIPLLPKFLISILSAPMPYICGIDKIYLNEAFLHLSDECIVVDLDCNHVMVGPNTPELLPLPREFEKKLFSKLNLLAGMVFREARSLAKEHDFSDRGQHLPAHVKATADAMWESKLCLWDEAFRLSFTPEHENDILNGHDDTNEQSKWDAVQEAFMTVYVELLSSYRQCLVFPSKDGQSTNEVGSIGSYGGAGFRSKEFIKIQKFDRRNFLKELIKTQMFDEFVTKRLYGSGAPDVAFFDRAIDNYLKKQRFSMDRSYHAESNNEEKDHHITRPSSRPSSAPANSVRKFLDRVRLSDNSKEESRPLICSARVHKKLKTIVPPEPSSEHLFDDNDGKNDSDEFSLKSLDSKETHDTALSSPISSFESSISDENESESQKKYQYTIFPSKLDKKLFGKPRPLPSAVLAEFERQKESAAQFRKRGKKVKNLDPLKSPEETTFTVFFMVLTNIIGRDLQKLSSNKHSVLDRTMMETHDIGHFGYDDSDSDSFISEPRNLRSEFLKSMPSSSSMSIATTDSSPRNRFRDPLYFSKLEEAKASAVAQLDLAFEMLDIMRERKLTARSVVYKCLIDACGRCGDTERATKLVNRMHDDGIVADGVVYSCLVTAFSAESSWRKASGNTDLPEWANGASVELDWNKVGKPSKHGSYINEGDQVTTLQSMMKKLRGLSSKEIDTSIDSDTTKDNKMIGSNHLLDGPLTPEKFVTPTVGNHIGFGENLLEIVYPDISIDTDDERCPSCNCLLLDDMVVSGWTPGNSQDYTTKCPLCSTKFVPTFRVQCTSQSFMGSRGPGTPLICERLSPWVLEKELRIKMADWDGIDDLLDSAW